MHFREATAADIPALIELYRDVSLIEGGIARLPHEIDAAYVSDFVSNSMSRGLIIVCEDPERQGTLIAEVHAFKSGLAVFDHVLSHLTLVVHPSYQGRKIGRTILAIFLEEIAMNRRDIGKVELISRESNQRAIALYQSLGFRIEGRLEMRLRNTERKYEADIPMGWQNPNFEF
jgi:ribosomal protein S18 acetylase RimI-like enzyme